MEPVAVSHHPPQERQYLLQLARQSLEAAATNSPPPSVEMGSCPADLREPGACFVTLRTADGDLRGCTGIMVAQRPLVEEIRRTAWQTARSDPRFNPVRPEEVPDIEIEISILTPPQPLYYDTPDGLVAALHPGTDGVMLSLGARRATFLPQVWEHVGNNRSEFLDRLCEKMGLPADTWRRQKMSVEIYHVEEFSESEDMV